MKLTSDKLRQTADAMDAAERGEPTQFQDSLGFWNDHCIPIHQWRIECFPFRPKPRPATRPWSGPDDVPGPVCWLRFNETSTNLLITFIGQASLTFGSDQHSYDFLTNAEYSTDRKTWHKCEVPA